MKKGRLIVSEYAHGIEVIIPAKKSLFVNFFLLIWLLAWAYGEMVIINKLLSNQSQTPDAFIVFFACGWTLSGLLAIFIGLWNNKGREIIRIGGSELRYSREYVWFSRSKTYETNRISHLRVSVISESTLELSSGTEFWGLSGGTITFDYGPGIVKIGLGLDETEAGHIIEVIKVRFRDF